MKKAQNIFILTITLILVIISVMFLRTQDIEDSLIEFALYVISVPLSLCVSYFISCIVVWIYLYFEKSLDRIFKMKEGLNDYGFLIRRRAEKMYFLEKSNYLKIPDWPWKFYSIFTEKDKGIKRELAELILKEFNYLSLDVAIRKHIVIPDCLLYSEKERMKDRAKEMVKEFSYEQVKKLYDPLSENFVSDILEESFFLMKKEDREKLSNYLDHRFTKKPKEYEIVKWLCYYLRNSNQVAFVEKRSELREKREVAIKEAIQEQKDWEAYLDRY